MLFKEVNLGDTFIDSIKDASYPYTGKQYQVFQKISKSEGRCLEQKGYGNTRAVGNTYKFGPNKSVIKTYIQEMEEITKVQS